MTWVEPVAEAVGSGIKAPPDESMTIGRACRALWRRARLQWLRVRHPRATFGKGCDIRSNFHLTLGQHGSVEVGEACVVDRSMTVECRGKLLIGARTIFGHHCTLGIEDSVEIGPDCLVAEMVSIRDHDHRFDRQDLPIRDQGSVCAPVQIGRNVWIGSKATVLRGVRIGDNAIVGANAVVSTNVQPNAIVAGVPARLLRMRA